MSGDDWRDEQDSLAWTLERPWRCGFKLGRTIYCQVGDEPAAEDFPIGIMDHEELAGAAVDAHNEALRRNG